MNEPSPPSVAELFAQLERQRTPPRVPRAPPGLALFRHLFVPAFLLLLVWPWASFANGGLQLSQATRPGAFGTGIFVAMLVAWLAEQLYPREPTWNVRLLSDGRRGWALLGRDLLYLLGVTQATAFLISAASPTVEAWMGALGAPLLWPSHAPFAVRALLAFLVVEFFSYWIHRAAHHWRLLWQFHSTHHVVTELNALKAVRTHPVDNLIFHLVRVAPLLLVGAGPEDAAAAVHFGAVLGILAHANVQVSEGALGLLINFPRWHAVHHSAELAESRSNFGCHTVLWDRVFGTFRRQGEGPLEIGVFPVGRRSLWQELAWPFYRRVDLTEEPADAVVEGSIPR